MVNELSEKLYEGKLLTKQKVTMIGRIAKRQDQQA